MAICSMTGFARSEGEIDGSRWTWEARSVNARGLEVRCRLPSGYESLEPAVRSRVGERMKRGSLLVTLTVFGTATPPAVRVNFDVLESLLAVLPDIRRRLPDCRAPTAEGLLSLRGVIELDDTMPSEEERSLRDAALLSGLDGVLARLVDSRRAEGARLAPILAGQIDRIAGLCAEANTVAATQPEAILARLKEQLAKLVGDMPAMSADRLAQEAALLAVRADAREELDRINAHCQAARTMLAGGGPAGRQLDFLCQEFNREANTLCAKSSDVELTRVGLDLKATIDQMREQVQNIE